MADNNRGFQPTPRKKNALDSKKLNLVAPCPTAPGKRSSLIWGVYSNNPRLTVYTGDPEDSTERTGYGKIAANLDTPTFFAFIEMLEASAKSTEECKQKIDNKGFTWFGGKRSEVPVVLNSLIVGKDAEGCVFISVVADNRPIIKFFIGPSESHALYHSTGKPFTKAESSSLYAIAYCQLLRNMVGNVLVSEYVEEVAKKPYNPQGGNNNNQGGGGYSKPQNNSYAEDIPF